MTLTLSTVARNAAGTAITALVELGSTYSNGYIEIRTGNKPSSPILSATGTLLATLQLSSPAFGPFTNGLASANPIAPDVNIDNNGIASWFRIYDRDGNGVIDGEITTTGGSGDIQFDNVNFLKGGTVQLVSLTALMP